MKVTYLKWLTPPPQAKRLIMKQLLSSYIFKAWKTFNKNIFKIFLLNIFMNIIFHHESEIMPFKENSNKNKAFISCC